MDLQLKGWLSILLLPSLHVFYDVQAWVTVLRLTEWWQNVQNPWLPCLCMLEKKEKTKKEKKSLLQQKDKLTAGKLNQCFLLFSSTQNFSKKRFQSNAPKTGQRSSISKVGCERQRKHPSCLEYQTSNMERTVQHLPVWAIQWITCTNVTRLCYLVRLHAACLDQMEAQWMGTQYCNAQKNLWPLHTPAPFFFLDVVLMWSRTPSIFNSNGELCHFVCGFLLVMIHEESSLIYSIVLKPRHRVFFLSLLIRFGFGWRKFLSRFLACVTRWLFQPESR